MIDSIKKNKLLVEMDENECVFLKISCTNDAERLANELSTKYYVFCHYEHSSKNQDYRLEFGALIDPQRLQEIIDRIDSK